MCVCVGGREDYYIISILKGSAYLEFIHTITQEGLLFFSSWSFCRNVVTFLILITSDHHVV